MVLWCHYEVNGTIGTYPYRKVSDHIQLLLQIHGIDNVKVCRYLQSKVSSASNRRRLPNGDIVWLNKVAPEPWKLTDKLFSLDCPYSFGKELFTEICRYFAAIPGMDGRWEVQIVEPDAPSEWSIAVNEETYEFLVEHWGIIPNSNPVRLSKQTADDVKEWLLHEYERQQRPRRTNAETYTPPRTLWLYIEEGTIIRKFYDDSELAHYIYTSDRPVEGLVKLVDEEFIPSVDLSTRGNMTAKQYLERHELFHPLFPPRDSEVPKRLRETRYILGGEKSTAKDMWERCYRSQIDDLIRSGEENYVAALLLMLPCMELVYKLKTGKSKSDWIAILKMFFPAMGFDHATYKQLANLIRNGFVHDGFAKGYVGISSKPHTPEEYSDSQQVFEGIRAESGQFNLLIIPAFYWARVRERIDNFYEYEQWIPGWDMHKVISINHYVEPITLDQMTQKA